MSECEFKVGDKVRVIDGNDLYPKGYEGVVKSVFHPEMGLAAMLEVSGLPSRVFAYRFELVKEAPIMSEKKFDPSKPVKTRDGRKARIVCTDRTGPFPIVALVMRMDRDHEENMSFSLDGRLANARNPCPSDLVNIPEKRKGWANIYSDGRDSFYRTKEDADYYSKTQRIACVEIEYEVP